MKYIWQKCYKNFFGCIFLGDILFKRFQNTPECSTGDPSNGGDDFEMKGG